MKPETRPECCPEPLWTQQKPLITLAFQARTAVRAILDSRKPSHYGPRGFEDGRFYLGLLAARCQKQGPILWPTTRATRAKAGAGQPKRPLSPRGSGISA